MKIQQIQPNFPRQFKHPARAQPWHEAIEDGTTIEPLEDALQRDHSTEAAL